MNHPMSSIDVRFRAAESAAECLGELQAATVNADATLTAVIHYAREFYFIVDISPAGELVSIHELRGADMERHRDDSMLNAVVQEQIRYNLAQEAIVDGFAARIPLTVLEGSDAGECCSVDGGCCGGASAQAESSDDDDEDHELEDVVGVRLFGNGIIELFGSNSSLNDELGFQAEQESPHEITVSFNSGAVFEFEIEWDGASAFFVATEHGESYFELDDPKIYMAGSLTADGIVWAPVYDAHGEE